MEKKWTDDQKKVIATRLGDLLVSAAAGSGKTAVLVERIIELATDADNPIDIDRFIIMTFTRAAAAQMREKISDRLEKLVQENPGNREYRRQQRLLNNANISTIDSFCIGIVRDYFHVLDLDPSFRIADETELKLIKDDCMDELLERWYAKADGDSGNPENDALYKEQFQLFVQLRESYAGHKDDSGLAEMIMSVASKALSAAWPDEWLDKAVKAYEIDSIAALDSSFITQNIVEYVKTAFKDFKDRLERGVNLCNMPDGPVFFLPMLEECVKLVDNVLACDSYSEMAVVLRGVKFMRMSGAKCADTDLRERVSALRESFKTFVTKKLAEDFFYDDTEAMVDTIRKSAPVVGCLVQLAREFLEAFAAKKRGMNVLDFNDAEHFALNILVDKTKTGKVRSAVALELQKQFDEIIIDEYQDSNEIQEELVNAIAGAEDERPYVFTVGDVKQSIYKFRNACPELFISKQDRFRKADEPGTLIVLDRNFRSREEVLEATNDVFKMVMHRSVGGIEYDDECSLKCGTEAQRNTDESWNTSLYKTECILINGDAVPLNLTAESDGAGAAENSGAGTGAAESTGAGTGAGENSGAGTGAAENSGAGTGAAESTEEFGGDDPGDELAEMNAREQEARLIAARIHHLVLEEGLPIKEERNGSVITRPVEYGDIVILLRTMKEWAEVFCRVLEEENIPVYSDVQAGFFKAAETALTLNYLRILDNPRDDLALVAVLTSFIGKLGPEELTEIKIIGGSECRYFYDAVQAARGAEPGLNEKLESFFKAYNALHSLKNEVSTSELISELFEQTGIYTYFSAMPDGRRRSGNLDLLLGYAANYEQTGYSGLFSFIRYIDKLKGKDLDYGEAGNANVAGCVKIMSIHKSKGLEFPVVILAGLGKQFNEMDYRGNLLISSEDGIGIKYVDLDARIRYKTLFSGAIKAGGITSMIGEEMRLLYVGMTRAKEKLIMTGNQKKLKDSLSHADILMSKTYADFVYPAARCSEQHINTLLVAPEDVGNTFWVKRLLQGVNTVPLAEKVSQNKASDESTGQREPGEIIQKEASGESTGQREPGEIIQREASGEVDFEELLRVRELVYPHISDAIIPVKLSVSDLKHQAIEEAEGENPFAETRGFVPGGDRTLPSFMKNTAQQLPEDTAVKVNAAEAVNVGITNEDNLREEEGTSSDRRANHAGHYLISATEYGTLMHKCMQFMNMSLKTTAEIRNFLREMLDRRQIDEAELSVLSSAVNVNRFATFLNQPLADRIRRAAEQKNFYAEKQFMIGIKACDADPSKYAGIEQMIPVQGVIDAMFEEDGELVILDYKTDSIAEGEEQKLAERYRVQLEYYAMAAERMTGLRVKEKLLYSFRLGRVIEV